MRPPNISSRSFHPHISVHNQDSVASEAGDVSEATWGGGCGAEGPPSRSGRSDGEPSRCAAVAMLCCSALSYSASRWASAAATGQGWRLASAGSTFSGLVSQLPASSSYIKQNGTWSTATQILDELYTNRRRNVCTGIITACIAQSG